MEIEQLYNIFCASKGICTDTRKVKEGCIFFALKGERFDANLFAADALAAGAAYAVVDNPEIAALNDRMILTDNVLETLQSLAAYHRGQLRIPVLGITGTNGKTTTKELCASVLSAKYHTVFTQGNLNNHIGVPLTVLSIDKDAEVAVVEMGANHPGEIAFSLNFSRPTCGLVTNVGEGHLEGFGSFEGVKRTKGELYDYLATVSGTIFYNSDSADLSQMVAQRSGASVIRYGVSDQKVALHPVTLSTPFLAFSFEGDDGVRREVSTNLVGNYNVDNVLAAICVGHFFGVPYDDIIAAVEAYKPSNNRSQLVKTDNNLLIVDAYNANVSSMNAALDNFAATDFEGKTLILGDMKELGEFSKDAHRQILNKARSITSDIYLVGRTEFRQVASDKEMIFDTVEDLITHLRENPLVSRSILIKGSNSNRLSALLGGILN